MWMQPANDTTRAMLVQAEADIPHARLVMRADELMAASRDRPGTRARGDPRRGRGVRDGALAERERSPASSPMPRRYRLTANVRKPSEDWIVDAQVILTDADWPDIQTWVDGNTAGAIAFLRGHIRGAVDIMDVQLIEVETDPTA
jgi:hypothetical protein